MLFLIRGSFVVWGGGRGEGGWLFWFSEAAKEPLAGLENECKVKGGEDQGEHLEKKWPRRCAIIFHGGSWIALHLQIGTGGTYTPEMSHGNSRLFFSPYKICKKYISVPNSNSLLYIFQKPFGRNHLLWLLQECSTPLLLIKAANSFQASTWKKNAATLKKFKLMWLIKRHRFFFPFQNNTVSLPNHFWSMYSSNPNIYGHI